MICCLRGDDGVDGGGKAGSPRAKAGKKSTSKADNAPGGAFGSPVPMSPTSDDEEFHDAEDTLPAIDPGSPKGASHRRTFSAALRDANAIALEEAADMVKSQGRMKYLRPLYRALRLYKDGGRAFAEKTFEEARRMYHPIAEKMVASDLGL